MYINSVMLAGGTALTFLISRLISFALPSKLYFTFESFLFDQTGHQRYYGLAFKLLGPLIAGFLAAVIVIYTPIVKASARRRAVYSLQSSLFCAGVLSALISAWPFITYWDILASPRVRDLKFLFIIIYFLYFISFGYFALLGGNLAQVLMRNRLPSHLASLAEKNVSWANNIRVAVFGSAASILATVMADFGVK